MFERAKIWVWFGALCLIACGDDGDGSHDHASGGSVAPEAGSGGGGASGTSGTGGSGGRSGAGGAGGATTRRSPLACNPPPSDPVKCGSVTCPTKTALEDSPCFVPCCLKFEGADRCGFRGAAPGFTTECVLPAMPDESCDQTPQFQGCCEPTQHVCGIIGGFAPGCQTKSNFVTLPASPKACTFGAPDGGTSDAGS